MHRECADYALEACPYIAFEFTRTRENATGSPAFADAVTIDLNKPSSYLLIGTAGYKPARSNTGAPAFAFKRPTVVQKFQYSEGRLKRIKG